MAKRHSIHFFALQEDVLGVLTAFVAYATWAAFVGNNYYVKPYISPFYSPCVAWQCGRAGVHGAGSVPHVHIHVYPAYNDVPSLSTTAKEVPVEELEKVAAEIRAKLPAR